MLLCSPLCYSLRFTPGHGLRSASEERGLLLNFDHDFAVFLILSLSSTNSTTDYKSYLKGGTRMQWVASYRALLSDLQLLRTVVILERSATGPYVRANREAIEATVTLQA